MSNDHPYSSISATVPSDSVISPDGTRLYVAGDDGFIRVLDASTGALLAAWDVGTRLGAIDISSDGTYLMAVEREPFEVAGTGNAPPSQAVTTYKVSTADGSVQSFPIALAHGSGPMHDVAILANGEVVLSQAGGAYGLLTLDTQTGIYSGAAPGNTAAALTVSEDRTHVLVAPVNVSGGYLYVYEQGVGVTAGGSRGDSGGPEGLSNVGIQAISESAGLVVQGPALSIFNLDLDWQFDLSTVMIEAGDVGGVVFDASGDNLYVLSSSRDEILQVSTGDWSIVRRFYIGSDAVTAHFATNYGNRLLLSADGSYFSVITASGVQRVENFALVTLAGTAGVDNLAGTDSAEAITGLGGDDDLAGGGGHDSIDGGDGDDRLSGGLGDDTLVGGAGNDLFVGGAGIDIILGGDGIDTVDYSADSNPDGAIVNLSTNVYVSRSSQFGETAAGPGEAFDDSGHLDRISGVENAKGGQFADWIIGNAAANRFDGGAGNDTLEGGSGDDQLYGEAGHDRLTGGAGNDLLVAGEGNDFLIGSAGSDEMRGGMGNDIYTVDAGDLIVENAGEGTDRIDTILAAYSLAGLANVENLTGTSALAHDFRGNSANNVITGNAGNDFLRLQDGGDDTANGGLGNDVFLFGAAFTSADKVNGGAGTDQIALQGDYSGATALTLGSNLSQIENLAILPGDDIRFGDPGTNFYDYQITVADSAVGFMVQFLVDANRLRAGEDLTFDGSSELDGSFFIYGGGGADLLTGGAKNDVFIFGGQGQWSAGDVLVGGGGIDQLALRGNYTITFGAGQLTGIEQIGMVSAQDTRYGALGSSYSYDLTMVDSNVDSIQMTVDASPLRPGETLDFDGSAEDDGSFRVFGGRDGDSIVGSGNADLIGGNGGSDSLTGGAGADVFRYVSTSDSTAAAVDRILDFAAGIDKIDLSRIDSNGAVAGDQAFAWIGSNAFSGSAGELRAYQSGADWFVEGDTDGNGAADLVIQLSVTGGPLTQADFLP